MCFFDSSLFPSSTNSFKEDEARYILRGPDKEKFNFFENQILTPLYNLVEVWRNLFDEDLSLRSNDQISAILSHESKKLMERHEKQIGSESSV